MLFLKKKLWLRNRIKALVNTFKRKKLHCDTPENVSDSCIRTVILLSVYDINVFIQNVQISPSVSVSTPLSVLAFTESIKTSGDSASSSVRYRHSHKL